MDNELTLDDIQNIDKFIKIGTTIQEHNNKIRNFQNAIKHLDKLNALYFDIAMDGDNKLTGYLAYDTRSDIRIELYNTLVPIIKQVFNKHIIEEFTEMKKLIGE